MRSATASVAASGRPGGHEVVDDERPLVHLGEEPRRNPIREAEGTRATAMATTTAAASHGRMRLARKQAQVPGP